MNTLAPIVLFVYNRPWHTRETLEALSKNILADESKLYIYADGPKENATEEQLQKIKEVRILIREKKWCREVEIIEREKNMGVDSSIITGITDIVNRFEKIIVLEDDLITSVGFLKYMNEALTLYEQDNEVMVVSGYNFPTRNNLPETFFLYGGTNPWGWGTWKRSWINFIPDSKYLYNNITRLSAQRVRQFNFNNSFDYLGMLRHSIDSENKPYDIRWYASVFLNEGFGLWPAKSLVQNIGHDNSGIHCNATNIYYHNDLAEFVNVKRQEVKHNEIAYKQVVRFYKKGNSYSFVRRILLKIKRLNFV